MVVHLKICFQNQHVLWFICIFFIEIQNFYLLFIYDENRQTNTCILFTNIFNIVKVHGQFVCRKKFNNR